MIHQWLTGQTARRQREPKRRLGGAGPVMTARADLVAILEALYVVLVRIDDEMIDRCYVDFGALAKRLEECIEQVQEFPSKS